MSLNFELSSAEFTPAEFTPALAGEHINQIPQLALAKTLIFMALTSMFA